MQFSRHFPFISRGKSKHEQFQIPETGTQTKEQPEVPGPPLAEIDTSGVSTLASQLDQAQENPDEILKREGRKIYDEMVDKDAHLNAVYTTRKLAISRIPWEIKPANSSPEAKTHADFVRNAITNCRGLFAEDIRQLADAIGKGFSVLEIRYKFIESGRWQGKYGIDELVFHKQRYWRFKKQQIKKLTSEEILFVGDFDFSGQTVPWEKVVHYAYMADDIPYGNAAFKPLFWMVWFKREAGWKLWVLFLEKFASPTIVGKHPPKASDPEKNKLLECITAIQQETGITIPDTMSVEFLEASHAGPASYATMIEACNAEMSKVLLGATQTVQEGRRGSYALAKTHSDVRRERVEADAIDIMDVIQQQLVKRLVDYNFKTEVYPQFLMRFPQARAIPVEEGPGRPEIVGPESEVFPLPGETDEKLAGPELTPEEQEIKLTPETEEIKLTPEKEEIRLAPETQEAMLIPEKMIPLPMYKETHYGQIPTGLPKAAERTLNRVIQDYTQQRIAGRKSEAHINAKYFKKAWLEVLPEHKAFQEAGRLSEDLRLALNRHVFSEQLETDKAVKKIHDIFSAQLWSRYSILPRSSKCPASSEVETKSDEMSRQDWIVAWKKDPHWGTSMKPSPLAKKLVSMEAESKTKGRILEIGCGNGRDSIYFGKQGHSVIGVDISPDAIKIAKANNTLDNVQFEVGDAEKLRFEDSSFDVVYSLSVLHSTKLKKSIAEVSRVLKKRGIALLYLYLKTTFLDEDGKEKSRTDVSFKITEMNELLKNNKLQILDKYKTESEDKDENGTHVHSIVVYFLRRK